MINKLKNISLKDHRYYVIGVSVREHIPEYQLLEIRFKNNELLIENRFFSNEFDPAFKEKLNKDYPVILHIEGDSIINKVVENKTGYRNNIIFKANPDEFYFFEYHQNETIFISVARKQSIDAIIKQIENSNLYVIHLSFGPFVMSNLLPIIKDYDTVSSSNYTVSIAEKEILSFKNESVLDKEYIINGDRFNQKETPLLATFLGYKYPNPAIEFDANFINNKSEYKFKKWFKIAGVFILAFFLTTLLTSHFLMGYYLNALAEKEFLYNASQQTTITINTLKEEQVLKEKILRSSGINNKMFLTKYMADIGNSVPSDIILNTIQVMPHLKKIKASEKINLNTNIITLTGESKNDNSFNDWLKKIEALAWIQKMDIENYSQETQTVNTFIIKIEI